MTDKPPDAIEGAEIVLSGKKIVINTGPPNYVKTLDDGVVMVFPVSIDRGGDAEIIKEYPASKPKIRVYSRIAEGAKISGKSLWGFTDKPQAQKVTKGGKGRSGRHTGQQMVLKSQICFMEIIHGHRGDALPTHPRKVLFSNPNLTP